jgi:gliding motility-associated-like protein
MMNFKLLNEKNLKNAQERKILKHHVDPVKTTQVIKIMYNRTKFCKFCLNLCLKALSRFLCLLIISLLLGQSIIAQPHNRSNLWYFSGVSLDFSLGNGALGANNNMQNFEGVGSICDTLGNLQFYTNGSTVFNKMGLIMQNGYELGGDTSSTQNGLCLPFPGHPKQYYVFSIDGDLVNEAYFSIVDMSQASGLGAVTVKKQFIMSSPTEKIAAIPHCNQKDYWVVAHADDNDAYWVWLLTEAGLSAPTVQHVGVDFDVYPSNIGQMKFSGTGQHLATAINKGADLLFFDRSNGILTHDKTIIDPDFKWTYGLEYSPNARFLYLTNHPELELTLPAVHQYDLSIGDPAQIVAQKQVFETVSTAMFWGLQVGPDGNIYSILAKYPNSYLGIIDNPDQYNCSFQADFYTMPDDFIGLTLPNLVHFHLQELDTLTVIDTTICQGQSFEQYIETGVYIDTLESYAGCDSVRVIHLTVSPSYADTLVLTICDADTYTVGDEILTESGQYSIQLVTQFGCDSLISLDLSLADIHFLGPDIVNCDASFDTIVLSKPLSSWSDGNPDSLRVVQENGFYMATYLDPNGCLVTDTLKVTLQIGHFTPNIFSPNNDGYNDIFKPNFSSDQIDAYELLIFDRWGNQLFATNDPDLGWDGLYRGIASPSQVYMFLAKIERMGCPDLILSWDFFLIK